MIKQIVDKYPITPRHLIFDFSEVSNHWLAKNPCATRMFDAASVILPYVEGLVRSCVMKGSRLVADTDLRKDCMSFVEQELWHAKQHLQYNRRLVGAGYQALDRRVAGLKKRLRWVQSKLPFLSKLAIAAGFECLTLLVSKIVLENNLLDYVNNAAGHFWRWHMLEEIEHKAVLMDLYRHLKGGYWRRVLMLSIVVAAYCYYSTTIYLALLKADGISRWSGLRYALRKESFFRKSLIAVLSCYKPSYHPDQENTRHLLEGNWNIRCCEVAE